MTESPLDGRQSADLPVFAELMQPANHSEDDMLDFSGTLAAPPAASWMYKSALMLNPAVVM